MPILKDLNCLIACVFLLYSGQRQILICAQENACQKINIYNVYQLYGHLLGFDNSKDHPIYKDNKETMEVSQITIECLTGSTFSSNTNIFRCQLPRYSKFNSIILDKNHKSYDPEIIISQMYFKCPSCRTSDEGGTSVHTIDFGKIRPKERYILMTWSWNVKCNDTYSFEVGVNVLMNRTIAIHDSNGLLQSIICHTAKYLNLTNLTFSCDDWMIEDIVLAAFGKRYKELIECEFEAKTQCMKILVWEVEEYEQLNRDADDHNNAKIIVTIICTCLCLLIILVVFLINFMLK